MLNDIEAVIFDVDGTLLDSNNVWLVIDKVFMAERGLDYDENFQKEIDGMSFHQVAEYSHDKYNLSETPDELIEIWHNMALEEYDNNVMAKPGAKEFTDYLTKKGIKLVIATSNSHDLIKKSLKRNGIYDCMEHIYSSKNIGETAKDSPEFYLNIASEINVEPSKCLVFDDIYPVIESVNKAGMRSCVVLDRRSVDIYGEDLLKSTADYYINDFTDIKLN